MKLTSGYGTEYDPFPALERLRAGDESALNDLWENLYHQGDVGSASYAAVPILVELGEISLVAAIEVARHQDRNPDVPSEFSSAYDEAINSALASSPSAEEHLQGYYAIHASSRNQHRLARAIDLVSIDEILAEYG